VGETRRSGEDWSREETCWASYAGGLLWWGWWKGRGVGSRGGVAALWPLAYYQWMASKRLVIFRPARDLRDTSFGRVLPPLASDEALSTLKRSHFPAACPESRVTR